MDAASPELTPEAAAKVGRIDWKTGEPHVVSHAYVAEFVKSRPGLHAYKVSHVDPLRSKKATAKVCFCLLLVSLVCVLCRCDWRDIANATVCDLLFFPSPWGNSGRYLNSTPWLAPLSL